MRHYKIVGATENYLKLRGNGKFILAKPKDVLMTQSNTIILKKDIIRKNKIKDFINSVIAGLIIIAFFMLMMLAWLFEEPEGYYRATDGSNGIHYEWVEGGDK